MNREEFILANESYARNLARKFARSWEGYPYVQDDFECHAIERLIIYANGKGRIKNKDGTCSEKYTDEDNKRLRVSLFSDMLDLSRHSNCKHISERITVHLLDSPRSPGVPTPHEFQDKGVYEEEYNRVCRLLIDEIKERDYNELKDGDYKIIRMVFDGLNFNNIRMKLSISKGTMNLRFQTIARKMVSCMGYPEGMARDLVNKRIEKRVFKKKGKKEGENV